MDAAHLVRFVLRRLEAVPIVDVDRRIRMSRSKSRHSDLGVDQRYLVEYATDGEQKLTSRLLGDGGLQQQNGGARSVRCARDDAAEAGRCERRVHGRRHGGRMFEQCGASATGGRRRMHRTDGRFLRQHDQLKALQRWAGRIRVQFVKFIALIKCLPAPAAARSAQRTPPRCSAVDGRWPDSGRSQC